MKRYGKMVKRVVVARTPQDTEWEEYQKELREAIVGVYAVSPTHIGDIKGYRRGKKV